MKKNKTTLKKIDVIIVFSSFNKNCSERTQKKQKYI
jgi:hypothetical protein